MKINTILLTTILGAGLLFQSCEKDEINIAQENTTENLKNKKSGNQKTSTILSDISYDIDNDVIYESVENPYSYSGDYLLNTLRNIQNQEEHVYVDEENMFNLVESELSAYGYSQTQVQNLRTEIEDIENNGDNIQDVLQDLNSNEPNNSLQLSLFSGMIEQFQLVTDVNEIKRISDIYTHHISNSSTLSSKEKKDLLTVTSDIIALADFSDESDWTNSVYASSSSDPNFITHLPAACSCAPSGAKCASSFLVPFLSGAIMGNGAGAIVGFFGGMATAYGNGCMG